jgi:protein gp37
MNKTAISYCDFSWNPIRGCARVSPGCQSCYAEAIAARFSGGPYVCGELGDPTAPFHGIATMTPAGPRWTGDVRLIEAKLDEPLRARRSAEKFLRQHGRKPIVFVEDMGDLFYERVPVEWQDRVFAVMREADWFDYLVLTKRAEEMAEYVLDGERFAYVNPSGCGCLCHEGCDNTGGCEHCEDVHVWPLPHVWLGVSAEDQQRADERIPHLLKLADAGWRTWISAEPLLGPINLDGVWGYPGSADGALLARWPVHALAIGGESGHGARPCQVEWIESLVSQAQAAGVKCHVKQLGSKPLIDRVTAPLGIGPQRDWWVKLRDAHGADPSEWPERLRVREWPESLRGAR